MAFQGYSIATNLGEYIKIIFRVDASPQIGAGHVMRCLTLADALTARGDVCQFICREHEGNLIEYLRAKGYLVHALPITEKACVASDGLSPRVSVQNSVHDNWIGGTQCEDANTCASILAEQLPEWLVVDHYALDAIWERALAPYCHKLMVIDDLADRPHSCDLLLDQTFGREAVDYLTRVSDRCRLLCGSQYALLKPEFAALRPCSLQRRSRRPPLRELLITMGGYDQSNSTGQVLNALHTCALPMECQITVVMGAEAPWLEDVRMQARNMPWLTRVLVGVTNMAQLMSDSDLTIGAAGSTAWERCCLGLPSAIMVLADNQRYAARHLENTKAVYVLDDEDHLHESMAQFISQVLNSKNYLAQLSENCSAITDGMGSKRVMQWLS